MKIRGIYQISATFRFFVASCFFVSVFIDCSQNASNETAASQDTLKSNLKVEIQELASGLDHPWGMAFLPDGRLLVTERAGDLRILDTENNLSDPLSGVPEVYAKGQGGLLDVVLDPDFETNSYVYLSFSEPDENNMASTALGRGELEDDGINNFTVIFRQEPKVQDENHFGGRIVFDGKETLFLTLGERFKFDPAQDLSNHLGTIVRLNRDGSIPEDNPFVDQADAKDEIWSYGHRNIESAAIDPSTGKLWVAEMGPQDGDELNQPEPGKNYGWPLVSWGEHYNGEDIPDPPTRPDLADAVMQWTPVISPSGMVFYSANMFSNWQESMLIGGLTANGLVRVEVDGTQTKEVERIDLGERIRDVEQAPDGSIYLLTDKDDGNVWKLIPED